MTAVLNHSALCVILSISSFADEAKDVANPGLRAGSSAAASDSAGQQEGAGNARDVAMRDVDATRGFNRLLLKANVREMEVGFQANAARDEFYRLSSRLMRENKNEWEPRIREIALHADELEKAKSNRDVARVMVDAESVKARMTPEELAAAEEKLRVLRRKVPEGTGEFYDMARKRFEMENAYANLVDENAKSIKEYLAIIMEARRNYLKLPMSIQQKYDPKIGEYGERVWLLRSKAESAKRAELNGEDRQVPEDEKWPAAQKRFFDALAEPVDLGDSTRPGGAATKP